MPDPSNADVDVDLPAAVDVRESDLLECQLQMVKCSSIFHADERHLRSAGPVYCGR